MGLLEPSNVPYSSRWFTVSEKNKSLRFIQDLQAINKANLNIPKPQQPINIQVQTWMNLLNPLGEDRSIPLVISTRAMININCQSIVETLQQ